MTKKLPFDTLELATLLTEGGVEKAQVHAASLATVITQNIYVKNEVDKMIEATFARFDKSMMEFKEQHHDFLLRLERDDARYAKQMLELENRLEKTIHHSVYKTITVLGALIVAVNAIAAFAHYFTH